MSKKNKRKAWVNATKSEYEGQKFDSKAELSYYITLKELLKDKKIRKIERQVRYSLPDMDGGKRFSYTVDFVVTKNDNKKVYIEVKGRFLPGNKLRYAYWQYVYGLKLTVIPTSGKDKFNLYWL